MTFVYIAAPGSMPRDLTPVPVDGDDLSVTLNWQPPQKPNGQITGKSRIATLVVKTESSSRILMHAWVR